MSDIFISYAKEDREKAKLLVEALAKTGWSVFWDRKIPTGRDWHSYVGKELEEAKCVLVVWSESSVSSKWVREEAGEANDRDILVPVLLDATKPPLGFRSAQALDISGWRGDPSASVVDRLIGDMERLLGGSRDESKLNRGLSKRSLRGPSGKRNTK